MISYMRNIQVAVKSSGQAMPMKVIKLQRWKGAELQSCTVAKVQSYTITKLQTWTIPKSHTGCPAKKLTFFKPVYLRPLISLRKSSVLEMNLWISSFKNTNSKFYRIFVFRDIKGIRYYSRFSGYSWPTFGTSEITNYFKMACICHMITIQV